ncbi:MAG TPA: zf-TFIIB domain-containing protein [Myxococcaceae bacterium]|nr:zf-TFIIB domain-containing protein [Myxococcaceae bacterium]
MSRYCPICPQQELRVIDMRGVQVDTCERCHGHWLDHGELERLAPGWKTEALLGALPEAPGRCRRAGHAVPPGETHCGSCGAPAAHCPACDERLALVNADVRAVDVCGHCRGLWLDASELKVLIRQQRERTLRTRVVAGAAVATAAAATAVALSGNAAPGASPQQSRGSMAGDVAEASLEVAETGLELVTEGADVVELASTGVEAVGEGIGAAVEGVEAVGEGIGGAVGAVLELLGGLFD